MIFDDTKKYIYFIAEVLTAVFCDHPLFLKRFSTPSLKKSVSPKAIAKIKSYVPHRTIDLHTRTQNPRCRFQLSQATRAPSRFAPHREPDKRRLFVPEETEIACKIEQKEIERPF